MGVFNYQEPTNGIAQFANAIQQMHTRNAEREKNTINGMRDLITGGVDAYKWQQRKNEVDSDPTARVAEIDARIAEIDKRLAEIDADVNGTVEPSGTAPTTEPNTPATLGVM